jgi:hypothetical protein
MATPTPDLQGTLARLLEQQDQLLQRITELQKPPGKDKWDKLGALSGVLIAIVGGLFSFLYSYHQSRQDEINQAHQAKLQEVQTVGTFMPYLIGNDDAAKGIALAEVQSILSDKAAIQIVDEINSAKKASGNSTLDPVAVRFLQRETESEKASAADKQMAAQVLSRVREARAPN